jgi:hypothetical protein
MNVSAFEFFIFTLILEILTAEALIVLRAEIVEGL